MRTRRMRRRCNRLIAELGPSPGTDPTGLCARAEQRLGRPVRLVPMDLDGVVSGVTATTDEAYWIFHERRTSPWHQVHIGLREIGHLLLGHEQRAAVTEHALEACAPTWTPPLRCAGWGSLPTSPGTTATATSPSRSPRSSARS